MVDALISDLDPSAALSGSDLIEVEQGVAPANTSGHVPLESLRVFIQRSPENVQADDYVLVLSDAFKLVTISAVGGKSITVPADSSVDFPLGVRVDIGQDGAGQVTVVPDDGVTVRTPETMKLRKQWAKATLIKRGPDLWDLEGNLEPAP